LPINLLFCGTYTDLSLQTGDTTDPPSGSDGIYVFRYDSETGQLSAPMMKSLGIATSVRMMLLD
jgi:hypothetical protein